MSNNNKGATTQSNNRGKYRYSDMGIGRAGASTQRHKGKPSVIRGVSLQSSSTIQRGTPSVDRSKHALHQLATPI